MIINTFQPGQTVTEAYAAFDTETHVLVDGEVWPDERIRAACAETNEAGEPRYPTGWWREHSAVECWAWICWTPSGWFIAESFQEWCEEVARRGIRVGWWYNAPFDMSIVDYHALMSGWHYTGSDKPKQAREYGEIASDYGARYQVNMRLPYGSRTAGKRVSTQSWKLTMYDLRNLLPGGLAANLKSFKITNESGAVRKLSMNYQAAGRDSLTPADIDYMRVDAEGLWRLVAAASAQFNARYGIRIDRGKPDTLTASGLAKKVFLRDIYPDDKDDRARLLHWRKRHPMSTALDAYYREHGLLGGGLVIVNPRYRGKHLSGIRANRYDANQHYPAIMRDMTLCTGRPEVFPDIATARATMPPGSFFIVEIAELYAVVRPDYCPCWRHPYAHDILPVIQWDRTAPAVDMFDFELDELRLWYDIRHELVRRVIAYRTEPCPALRERILKQYALKVAAKKAGDKAAEITAKLFSNGLGGKFSQNPTHYRIERELTPEGYVHLAEGTLPETDEAGTMHIVQGAYITAQGRTRLRRKAREICAAGGLTVSEGLLYTDTDSIHTITDYTAADPYALGEFKRENSAPIVDALFLAPKTYYEQEDGGALELHAKGVNTEAIRALISAGEKPWHVYKPGRRIQSLSALNVPGGKALLPLPKYLCRPESAPDEINF